MTASPFVAAEPHFSWCCQMESPVITPLCVFIKHHNRFATRPEVGPYFWLGISLWNRLLFYGRICRAGLLSRFSVSLPRFKLPFLDLFHYCRSSAIAHQPLEFSTPPPSDPAVHAPSNKHVLIQFRYEGKGRLS